MKLAKMQRQALERAAQQTHIWSYTPGSRLEGHYEPGCFHHAVIKRLVVAGYLRFEAPYASTVYAGGYAITDAGRAALGTTTEGKNL